jgi:hypothetical protein
MQAERIRGVRCLRLLNCVFSLQFALIAGIANQSNHRRDCEQDIELDEENEPIIKMSKPDENRAAANSYIRDELNDKNKPKRFSPNFAAPNPPTNWPEQQAAGINHKAQRSQKDVCEGSAHGRSLTTELSDARGPACWNWPAACAARIRRSDFVRHGLPVVYQLDCEARSKFGHSCDAVGLDTRRNPVRRSRPQVDKYSEPWIKFFDTTPQRPKQMQ